MTPPTPEEIKLAIDGVNRGKYQRCTWPGYLRIENINGETVITNLEETK